MSDTTRSAVSQLRPSASASAFGAAAPQATPSGFPAAAPAASQQSLSSSRDPQLLRPPSRSASTSVIGDRIVAPPPQQHGTSSALGGSLFSGFMGFGQRAAAPGQVMGEQILPKPLAKGAFGPIGSRPRAASGQLPSQQSSQQYGLMQPSQPDALAPGMTSMSSWGSEQSSQPDLALNGRQGSGPSGEPSTFKL